VTDRDATDDAGWTLNLAVFRVVFLGLVCLPAAWTVFRWTERVMPDIALEAWHPISLFALVPLDILSDPSLARTLALVEVALVALGLLGVATRWTLGLAAALGVYTFGLPQNLGKVTHIMHVTWLLALLAASPCAEALTLRHALSLVRGRAFFVRASPHALTALRLAWVLLGLVYLGPGIAKLHAALLDGWLDADNLRRILQRGIIHHELYAGGTRSAAAAAAELPSALLSLGGALVIALEIGLIAAVQVRPLRLLAAAAGVSFHVMNGVILQIWFLSLVPVFAALVDWSALLERARSARGGMRDRDTRPGPAQEGPAPRPAALLVVGALLVAAEACATGLQLGTRFADGEGPTATARPWRDWRWPFDCYPTFAGRREAELVCWQVRLVRGDGVEVALEPATYRRAFAAASIAASSMGAAAAEPDPERRRTRWRGIVESLLPRVPEALRAEAVEARVYELRFDAGRPRPGPLSERLACTLPVGP